MNVRQKRVRAKKIGTNTLKMRQELWSKLKVKEQDLWQRNKQQGYTTIP